MVQVQKAYSLMRYLNVQYLMLYNKPTSNNEKVSHVRYRTGCVNYLTNCIRELPVLDVWQIHFSTWQILLALLCHFFSIFVLPDGLHDTYINLMAIQAPCFCCGQSTVQSKCPLQDSVITFRCTGGAHIIGQHCPIFLVKVNPLRPDLNVQCTLKRPRNSVDAVTLRDLGDIFLW